jgi:repressor of nif and glnA expression
MIISKVDALSHLTTFDIETQSGDIILNVSLIPQNHCTRALEIVEETFKAELGFTNLLTVAHAGETLGGLTIPEGMTGLGTVCSLTINGILLNRCIPVYSKFSGLLKVQKSQPVRFIELIYYDASSLDPAEIFIKSKMTDVQGAVKSGDGKVLAGFREFPAICLDDVMEIVAALENIGLSVVTAIGRPSQPILETPVSPGCVGMVVLGGLNPLAAVEEVGIKTDNKALSAMVNFNVLTDISHLKD